jgi:hypothetical protein
MKTIDSLLAHIDKITHNAKEGQEKDMSIQKKLSREDSAVVTPFFLSLSLSHTHTHVHLCDKKFTCGGRWWGISFTGSSTMKEPQQYHTSLCVKFCICSYLHLREASF